MANKNNITFNIKATATYGQLKALNRAIDGVAKSVSELGTSMSRFNSQMSRIERNYNAATQSVKNLSTAHTKLTASVRSSEQAQSRYDALTKRQISLNRTLKSSLASLVTSKENLAKAERNLAKETKVGDAGRIQDAQRAHAEAKRAFQDEIASVNKLQKEYDDLSKQRQTLTTEIRNQKTATESLFGSLSKESQKSVGWVRDIIGELGGLGKKLNATETTATKMGDTLREINRVAGYKGKMGLEESARNTLEILHKTDAAFDRFAADRDKDHAEAIAQQKKEAAAAEKSLRERNQWYMKLRVASLENEQREQAAHQRTLDKWLAGVKKASAAQEKADRDQMARGARLAAEIDERLAKEHAAALKLNAAYDETARKREEDARKWAAAGGGGAVPPNVDKAIREMATASRKATQDVDKLHNALRKMVASAASAFRSFAGAGANVFGGFNRTLMTAQTRVGAFATSVQHAMNTAKRAMTHFYNSGWSLLTSGYMFQNFGEQLSRQLMMGFQDYVEYERVLTRTAIAGQITEQSPYAQQHGTGARPDFIQDMVFALQRGNLGYEGEQPLAMFDAKQLAEALYFYASAVGQEITPENMGDLAPIMSNILQLSAATMTELETATKGVLNIAMEFGIDPRDALENRMTTGAEDYKLLEQLPSQLAYLANISTMEVPDIVETFKMVGPMAHILSENSEEAGAGLVETMALTYFASEVGLRGGNVGRGVNQMLTTLLDPTDKALETASEAFGIAASEEAFKAFFFNSEGELEGGLQGLFDKLTGLSDETLAPLLATLFTTNATRSVIGIAEALKRKPLQEIIDELSGPEALGFLPAAFETTSKTLGTSLQNMRNALFQFKTAIITAVKGPLMDIFNAVADAFFRMTDIVVDNPWIGQVLAGVIAFTAAISTLVGTLFMAGGSLLLMLKAFTIFGGMMGPAILLIASFTTAILALIPIIALFGGAFLYLRNEWNDADSTFRTTVLGWKDSLQEALGGALGDAPTTLSNLFDRVNYAAIVAGDRIVEWGRRNRETFMLVLQSLRDMASGFVTGFTAITAAFAVFSGRGIEKAVDLIDQLLDRGTALIERFTGVEREAMNLSKVIGGVLGGVFGALVLRHFVPSIVMTVALRASFLALRATMVAMAAGALIVQGAFQALQLTMTVLQALWSSLSVVYTAYKAAEIAASSAAAAAKAGETVATTALTGATSALTVVVNMLTAAVLMLVIAYFAVGAALAALLVGMVAMIAIQDGWRAGLEAGRQALMGVVEGFLMVTVPLLKVVAGFAIFVGKLLEFVGVSNNVHAIGVLLGVWLAGLVVAVVAVTAALAALATLITAVVVVAILQWIAAVIAANLPIIAIVALITLLLGVLSEILGFDGVFDMLAAGFDHVVKFVNTAVEAIKRFGSAIKDVFTSSKNEVLEAQILLIDQDMQERAREIGVNVGDAYNEAQIQALGNMEFTSKALEEKYTTDYLPYGYSRADFFQGEGNEGWIREALTTEKLSGDFYYNDLIKERAALEKELGGIPTSNVNADQYRYPTPDASGTDFTAPTDEGAEGWWDRIQGWMNEFGFDPSDPTGSFMNMIGLGTLDDFSKEMDSANMLGVGTPEQQRYFEQLQDWQEYQTAIQDHAEFLARSAGEKWGLLSAGERENFVQQATSEINAYWPKIGLQVPLEPVLDMTEAEDDIAKFQEFIKNTTDEINAGMAQGADFAKVMGIAYGGPQGRQTVAGGIMANAETILGAIGDSAPWMNVTELLADAAISGNLGADLSGKNLQTAFEPILRRTAADTGVAIETILQELPRFVADDRLVGMATTEMLEGLDRIPWQIGDKLDHIGVGIQDRWGNFVAENGLDWNELATYAASQGMNTDWNLIDYFVEAWDMTRAEAEAYAEANGIDPNVISGALFGDTQMMAASMNGAITVMNEEWYAWLQEQTANGEKILRVTQEQFDAIPDAIKIGMSNSGYAFVVGGEGMRTSIVAAGKNVAEGFEAATLLWNDFTGGTVTQEQSTQFWDNFWDDAAADGAINRANMDIEYWNDGVQDMVTIQDTLTGITFTMPLVEYEATLESVRQGAVAADELESLKHRLELAREDYHNLDPLNTTMMMNLAIEYDVLGEGETVVSDDIARAVTDLGSGFGENLVSTSALEDRVREAIRSRIERLRAAVGYTDEGGTETVEVPLEIKITEAVVDEVAGDFATNFTTQLNSHLSGGEVALTGFTTLGTTAAEDFKTGFETALRDWKPVIAENNDTPNVPKRSWGRPQFGGGGGTAAPKDTAVTIDANILPYVAKHTQVNTMLFAMGMKVVNPTIGADILPYVEKHTQVNTMLYALDTRNVSPSVTLDAAAAFAQIGSMFEMLRLLDGKVATITVKTIQQTSRQEAAGGGVIHSDMTLVGERGPELVSLPRGSRVSTAGKTEQLFADSNAELHNIFASAARSEQQSASAQNSGGTTVIIQNVNINNDQDGKRFFEQLDRWQGNKVQLANRGMIPTDTNYA